MSCSIASCPNRKTQGAHVKPKVTFSERENDRADNIIPLCPSHHDLFDDGLIGIDFEKNRLIGKMGSEPRIYQSSFNLSRIRKEYIDEKNNYCDYFIRLWLGKISGASYAKLP